MDFGWTNDQHQLAEHSRYEDKIEEARKKLPKDYDPWESHYEENELDGQRHLETGGFLVGQIPPQFGVLSHPNPGNLRHYLRYNKGDEHEMGRSEDNGLYEAAKFNQHLNPRINRVGNYKTDGSNVIRTVDDMKAGILAHFPDVGGLVTSVRGS